jgi:pimeloyl-ACP methyl ester carboxylesterase
MENQRNKAADLFDLMGKIGRLYTTRALAAQKNFMGHAQKAIMDVKPAEGAVSDNPWQAWTSYATDFAQRSVLFWDVLRERGNNYIEHKKEGTPPLLAFKWEIISDGRTFARPVNYALIRIIPPEGVKVDDTRRPFLIVDPRAGHGPGIGGFKKDSEVGVALQFGHPVYFVIFFPEPEPGQTILDVSAAETKFLESVVKRHPKSPKPTIYGNCQGGWASMMIAANDPEMVGPIVINGAPMSYWSGSWSGGEGENPMRYSGGLLGGSWLSLFASDMGNGKFDGAYLVENFENLNPANTFWNKYHNLWKNVDTERERFLEFEKWWGGYFLMNEEEIRWIVDNLFVGDNITPPQQAINWIADVYSSTAEIKANGQVIVALLQEDVGHLGIFVSGKVAQKEHTEIIEALDYIEMLRPGLYVMELEETSGKGKNKYLSSFREVRLEDMHEFNRLQRKDEKPFEVVAEVSLLNEKAYSLFGRPIVKSMVNEKTAELGRNLHSLRVQRWLLSDINPIMWPVGVMASKVEADRKPVTDDNPFRRLEEMGSEMITAFWNFYRDMRDAESEAKFFQIYGSMIALGASGDVKPGLQPLQQPDPRELPFIKEALAQIEKGGYPEAIARISSLIGRFAGTIPLLRLEQAEEIVRSDKVLSKLTEDRKRHLRSEAEVMALLEPEFTLHALPKLLSKKQEREQAMSILEWGQTLEGLTKEQRDMIGKITAVLSEKEAGAGAGNASKKKTQKK